jgi:hypothetical protein
MCWVADRAEIGHLNDNPPIPWSELGRKLSHRQAANEGQGSGNVVDQQASVRQVASDVQLVARRVQGGVELEICRSESI